MGALIIYDITKQSTFDNVQKWLTELRDNSEEELVVILVGNKDDLEDQRQTPTSDAEEFAKRHGLAFIETSAKNSHNVETSFKIIVKS